MPRKVILAGILILSPFAFRLSPFPIASAQTSGPQFLLTWAAQNSYIPPDYAGKALPNQGSKITASVALVGANGQLVNIKNQTIYWYLNDAFVGGGIGMQTVTLTPFAGAPAYMTLKVELPDYNGNLLAHSIQIPVIKPKAVIEIQHVNGQFSSNPLVLTGTPYFFNITDPSQLSYQWSVNGQTPSSAENPETLQVNLSQGTPSNSVFAITLSITNPTDAMSAADSTNLTYTK
ncbi:MAG: hypothetical protein KGJ13_04940 [Patescibacteria group bacterium]|nr:hypothetical protein [Patescibacteria group bacterium]